LKIEKKNSTSKFFNSKKFNKSRNLIDLEKLILNIYFFGGFDKVFHTLKYFILHIRKKSEDCIEHIQIKSSRFNLHYKMLTQTISN
jgi:hypothetical protein